MTQPAASTGPGVMLKERREALGLNQAQVAAQLNLKAAVIHQLESQQWDPRVAPTFIRGYLRQYARLLKLDEADVLAQFDSLLAALPPPTPMHSFSKKTSRDAAESRFMLATYFLLVLLIGLFLVWFWQTHMLNDPPVSMLPELETPAAAAQVTTTATTPAITTSQENTVPALTVVADPTLPAAVTTGQPPAQATTAAGTPTAAETTPVPAAATDTHAGTVAAAESVTQPPTAAVTTEPVALSPSEPPAESANPDAVASGVAAAGAELQLQLQFSAQCWVAVVDANGKRLAYNMQNSGQTLNLTGVAPLKVTLGDPAAVTASLSGKTIDLSSYKQGQVARLTLTGSE